MLGTSEGLSLRIDGVNLRCCMARVRARLWSDGGGLDGKELRKHGIFQPIIGASRWPDMVISNLRKIRSLVRANRNRLSLGRSPPSAVQWRHAGLRWLEASRKYARPMNRNVKVPRPKPPWPPIYSIVDEIKRKTGRRRNEGIYQATSVDVLKTLSKASRQDDIETSNQSSGPRPSMQTLAGSPVAAAAAAARPSHT